MVISLDIGTSSARAAVYDDAGHAVPGRFHQAPYAPTLTHDGGSEHDAQTLLDATARCLDAICADRPRLDDVRGVGVATFWHGLLGFDSANRAVTPLYMWADSRSAGEANLLKGALDDDALHARTGCHLHSVYWPAKLRWLARARPDEARRVARWGSIGEHLELALFGEATTSVSLASGTGLLDLERTRWDPEALAAADIEESRLFRLRDLAEPRRGLRAPWARRWPQLAAVPWYPAVGDGAASSIGSDCIDPGRIALNVGTSAALRVVTSDAPPPRGLWRYRLDRRRALLGGATNEGGNLFAWCRELLRLPDDAALEAALAAAAPDAHGLTVLPFIAGERAPGWRGERRAVIAGLSLDTRAVDVARAVLEAVALRLALIHALVAPYAAPDHVIVGSGGAIGHSRVLTQIIADALGRPLARSRESEATSRGAALLTLESLGAIPDLAAARQPLGETIEPDGASHARYRVALERQRLLDERV